MPRRAVLAVIAASASVLVLIVAVACWPGGDSSAPNPPLLNRPPPWRGRAAGSAIVFAGRPWRAPGVRARQPGRHRDARNRPPGRQDHRREWRKGRVHGHNLGAQWSATRAQFRAIAGAARRLGGGRHRQNLRQLTKDGQQQAPHVVARWRDDCVHRCTGQRAGTRPNFRHACGRMSRDSAFEGCASRRRGLGAGRLVYRRFARAGNGRAALANDGRRAATGATAAGFRAIVLLARLVI